ncbi:MAG: hypothetical protein NC184_00670 [Roseburia sp.]|nr:hypothetical protein [Roseburia sp.]
MEQFLIIIAIIAACVLLGRAVAPPRRPDFTVRDRLPMDGIVYAAAALGNACRSTERGNGVDMRSLSELRRILSKLFKDKSTRDREAWEITLMRSEKVIVGATEKSKRALRSCYMLGHVRSFPRVFLLCNKVVCSALGDVSETVFTEAVKAFCKTAPLTYSEISVLPDMLRFCLLGVMYTVAEKAYEDLGIYRKGEADGAVGKIDLDSLRLCDYVCGLYSKASAATAAVYDSILSGNGINRAECERSERLKLAKVNAIIDAAVRSLATADMFDVQKLTELSSAHAILLSDRSYRALDAKTWAACLLRIEKYAKKNGTSEEEQAWRAISETERSGNEIADIILKRHVRNKELRLFLMWAPVLLFVVAFVLVCIFSPPRYAAIFPVSAVIIYACFRLFVPVEAVRILAKPSDIMTAALAKWRGHISSNASERVIPLESTGELSGDVAECRRDTLCGGVFTVADDCGAVTVIDSNDSEDTACSLGVGICVGSHAIDLPMCDASFIGYKSVYRAVTESVEFSAQLVSVADAKCCCIKLTALNRTDAKIHVVLAVACEPILSDSADALLCETVKISGGAALYGRGVSIGIGMGTDAEYFGVERAAEHAACGLRIFGKSLAPKLSALKSVEIGGFSRVEETVCVAFADGCRMLERQLALARSDGYFEFAESAARVYCDRMNKLREADIKIPEIAGRYVALETENTKLKARGVAVIPKSEYALKLGIGGFLKDGGYAIEYADGAPGREWKNCLCDGEICSEMTHSGGSFFYGNALPRALTADLRGDRGLPSAFVAIGERGCIWSPTARPIGKGDLAVVHRFGYSEFLCEYKGVRCSLKRYIARGKRAEIFDLTAENRETTERKLDVMFAISAADGWKDVEIDKDGVTVSDGEHRFSILSSERVRSATAYREGYFSNGMVDRTCMFGKTGSVIAPALSVRVCVAPRGKHRAVFCIAAMAENGIEKIDLSSADAYFSENVAVFKSLGRVKLASSDILLDCFHRWSLYQSYVYGFLRQKAVGTSVTRAALISCVSVKYIDITAVKDTLLSACALQSADGSIALIDGRSPYDCLLLLYAVKDYIEYTDDYSILEETARFVFRKRESKVVRYATVAEHCMLAVERAIELYNSASNKKLRRIYLAILRFYADCCADTKRRTAFIAEYGKRVGERSRSRVETPCEASEAADGARVYGIAAIDALLRISELFDADETDIAFGELKRIIERGDTAESAFRYGAEPYFICEYILRGDMYGVAYGEGHDAAAVFYAVVTEKLMGVKIRGSRARLDPKPPVEALGMEYVLAACKSDVRVSVDTSEPVGEWQIRTDRITYATDSIDISDRCERHVILRRSGDKK